MNEELQNVLASVLERSMEVAEKTGQWALDMAPELIQQFLMWELWSNVVTLSISTILLFVTYKFGRYVFTEWNKTIDEKENSWLFDVTRYTIIKDSVHPSMLLIFLGLSSIFVVLFSVLSFIDSTYTILQILIAPEIYLIQYFL